MPTIVALSVHLCGAGFTGIVGLRTHMVQHSWNATCEEMGERLLLTPAVAKLRPQLRRELKTKIKPLVKAMYGFKTGQNNKTIPYNQKLTEDLKEGSVFAFKVATDPGTEFGSFKDKPNSVTQDHITTLCDLLVSIFQFHAHPKCLYMWFEV
ncbi:hypothetical protein B0H10DRAFT_1942220 [Mycena sp. CBHHK59/15]|nr:hypothetical protein B0H10DRAFT_1942220 [Mycena sp. CBHHK59/15]